MDFLGIIATALTGGGVGIIGSIISKGIGLFEAYQKREDRKLEFSHELALLDRQEAIARSETENALAIANAETSAALRQASYAHDASSGRPHTWVVDLLRLVRPVLTLILIFLVLTIYLNDPITRDEIEAAVVFMCSSSVLWWFGDRAMASKK